MPDWSKYPALPEAPELPEWRDTPERETYFEEFERRCRRPPFLVVCLLLYTGGVAAVCAGAWCLSRITHADLGSLLSLCGGMSILLFLLVWLFYRCFWRIRLAFEYGVFPLRLRRREVSAEVDAVLAARPDFDEEEFRKYWPTVADADAAVRVLDLVRENWDVPDKMFYPNDSQLLFFSRKLIGDDEDFTDEFGSGREAEAAIGYDRSLADLVEAYRKAHDCE